ncbi:anhydro-N-acetylmuramic acid kinase [Candidatus Sumerlaeota bacterium]|nr:anhydro-N-acetylmuramic acid kinase [Candidatus Sumerlaeota bacterium]
MDGMRNLDISSNGGEFLAIGLMSGTSVDCVDAALAHFTIHEGKFRHQLLEFTSVNYPKEIRAKIFTAFQDGVGSLSMACELNFEIGAVFAKAAQRLINSSGFPRHSIHVIGSHGQTLYHQPPGNKSRKKYTPSTLQLGEASVIALKTGIPVVSDFRTADMAAGGQGAPLIPLADYHLFSHEKKTRIIQNIGGIANCAYLPANGSLDDVIAFDTGPGNMVIDGLVSSYSNGRELYDKRGTRAFKGKINEKLLAILLKDAYFSKSPPKTTGRELFGENYVRNLIELGKKMKLSHDDVIATASQLTIETIMQAYKRFLFPRGIAGEVILGGGGARNRFLVNGMRTHLQPDVKLLTHESLGVNSKAKEAIGFALLGLLCLLGIPGNIPSATGARKAVPLGKIYYP